MPHNKKHHYVPRFYLKKFSNNGRSVCVYNLPSKKIITDANLKNQCYKNYMYGADNTVEHALANIEYQISILFNGIDHFGFLPPAFSEPHAFFVMATLVQYGRTQHSADSMDEFFDKMFKNTFKKQFEAEHRDIDLDDFIIGIKDSASYATGMAMKGFPYVLDLECKLLLNETNTEFITSDNPVVFINPLLSFRKFCSNTGLSSKGLQIYYPLSPSKTAVLFDKKVYRVGSDSKPTVRVSNPQDVYSLNILQACSCLQNLYYRDSNINISAIHKNAIPYLRGEKVHVKSFPQQDDEYGKSELVINYKEDILYKPKLSFFSLRNSSKDWLKTQKKSRTHPGMVFRNEPFHRAVDELIKKLDEDDFDDVNIIDSLSKI